MKSLLDREELVDVEMIWKVFLLIVGGGRGAVVGGHGI